jgi:hypothetical protein
MPGNDASRHDGPSLPQELVDSLAMPNAQGHQDYAADPGFADGSGMLAEGHGPMAGLDPYAHDFGRERQAPGAEAGGGLPFASSGVPFENAERHGWGKGFMATVYAVMFQGASFYEGLGTARSLGPGYVFFLIMGYIAILGAVVWGKALALLLPELGALFIAELPLPALLTVAPLALGMALLFITGCMRLQLRILAPTKADFALSYRIVAYSAAPFMLCIVPFAGPPLGACWWLFSLLMGCRHALRLSWAAAALVPLPPALLLLAGVCWFFFGSI